MLDYRKQIKKFFLLFFFLYIYILFPGQARALEEVKIYFFYSKSCPHCLNEKAFLQELEQKHENVNIEMREVTSNIENSQLLSKVKQALGTENSYVPYTVIGKIGLTGYSENVKLQIEHFVEKYSYQKVDDFVYSIQNGEEIPEEPNDNEASNDDETKDVQENMMVPVLGKINPRDVSLPLLAIILGAIDGFNPCAMWVLLFLISMLMGMKDEKRRWILGFTFLFTSALIYFLFMVSWLKIAISITSIIWIQKIIAMVALGAGGWNLYQFSKSKEAGCLIVKEEKRKKIFSRIGKIDKQNSFFLKIIGIMMLAISVNVVELACSAGLPLLFTQILAFNHLPMIEYFIYIFMYLVFFMLDDIIIFVIAMLTMKISGISSKYAKYSHLIGGIIMFAIGILLLWKPEWLSFGF